ncbi:MAG: biotin--[acetyl-CoA-carboxylase] ligase [Phycisphaerae bacterium]|nr:biotin--[acetyl-CoA-carboxylase] ligase [Phycisphaerae bacterium]
MTGKLTESLDSDRISANLKTTRIGKKLFVYKSTSSTNDVALRCANKAVNDGLVVFAENQTAGRGRGKNKWQSSAGKSLLCSILLVGYKLAQQTISLLAAVAAAEAVGEEAKIKFPNDIILNNKKAAGILIESRQNGDSTSFVIGVGINCHQQAEDFPEDIRDTATSIDLNSPRQCDRNIVARRLLRSMDSWLKRVAKNPDALADAWQQRSSQFGHSVTVIYNGRKFSGVCMGIDTEKGLILRMERGGIRIFEPAQSSILSVS